ncbi:MAG: hypothetical protein ACKO34_05055 [Vampirovibrionales bacterium]
MMSVSSVPQFAPVGSGVKPESSKKSSEAKLAPREEAFTPFVPSAEASIPSSSMADLASQPDSFQSSQTSTEPTSVTPEVSTPPATEQGWTNKQKIMAGAGAAVALVGGLLVGNGMKNLPKTAEEFINAGKELGIELVEAGKKQAKTMTTIPSTVAPPVTTNVENGGFSWFGKTPAGKVARGGVALGIVEELGAHLLGVPSAGIFEATFNGLSPLLHLGGSADVVEATAKTAGDVVETTAKTAGDVVKATTEAVKPS